jgi:hypothetical protein
VGLPAGVTMQGAGGIIMAGGAVIAAGGAVCNMLTNW